MLRRLLPALAAVVLVSLVAGPAAARSTGKHAEGPAERVTFGLGPGGQAFIDERATLTYTVPPGGEVVDRVAVFNQSNQKLPLLVYAADAVNSESGKLDAQPRAAQPQDLGGWVRLGAHANGVPVKGRSLVQVSVPAQNRTKGIGKVLLPIRISVPRDASPGDHAAAVVAGLLARGDNATSANLELEQRVALRVYVRVSGAVRAGLAVKVRNVDYEGGSGLGLEGTLRVTYEVRNTGNVRLGATTALKAKGPFGLGSWSVTGPPVQELVPGGRARLTAQIKGVWPTIVGHVTVTATAQAAPSSTAPKLAPVSDTARYWAMTWQEVAAVLLLIGLVVYRRWRRATRREPRHAKPGPNRKDLVGAVTAVLLLSVVTLAFTQGKADAAVLGAIAVSPNVGHDETLFTGAIKDARCPNGTGDSFFTVDGPDIPRNAAFIGGGAAKGTGYQFFRNASIANIRTTHSGAFTHSGAYTIRFSCVRFSDGKVVDSYTRVMDYTAGRKGSWRLRGTSATAPTRPALPGDPYAVDPYAVARAEAKAAATKPPSPSALRPSATSSATGVPPSGSTPAPTGAAASVATAATDEDGPPLLGWALGIGVLFGGTVALAEWQRRRARHPRERTGVRQPASP